MLTTTNQFFRCTLFCLLLAFTNLLQSQSITQTIRGKVTDRDSHAPLSSVKIILPNSDPILGAITDQEGNFRIENVAVGRVDLKVSLLGYEDRSIPNLLLGSGKELILNIELLESIHTLDEVIIGAKKDKSQVLNEMAVISARSFFSRRNQAICRSNR